MPAQTRTSHTRYIPAIDGLRAFAVFAVILYHLGLPFAKGGLLGVTVFFVISGYLITGLLTAEWSRSSTINLPQFWLRRIRRLFPAIFTVIFVMAAVYTVFSPLLLSKMRPDIIPGLFWFENWWYIIRDLSYFEAMGVPSPLTHFWSLAIEEQFYLVWPVILLVVYKLGVNKAFVRRMCLLLAVVSAVAMAILYDPAGDPSRVYYGTDTRAFSLLIGAWLSFAWPSAQLTEQSALRTPPSTLRMLDAIGLAAFLGIVALCVFVSGLSDFMYYGGLVLCSVLSAIVIAVLVHPRTLLSKIAAWKPFVWIGKISYGMYLWHFPLIALLQPRNMTAVPWWLYLVEIALTIVVSALSYYFIESPIRSRGLNAFRAFAGDSAAAQSTVLGSLGDTTAGVKPRFSSWVQTHIPATVAAGLVAACALGGIAFMPAVSEGGAAADEQRVMSATLVKPIAENAYDVVFIGDSVSLGAYELLCDAFPQGIVNTEGNRQLDQGIEVLASYLDQGKVGPDVVLSMGTNGAVTTEELDQVMEMCGPDRTVWFVNIHIPATLIEPNSPIIQECVDKYANAKLIDWYSASVGHDEWFIEDGIHLTEVGREAYVNLVLDTMEYVNPGEVPRTYDVVFLGDAVALGAVEEVAAIFPYGLVDCAEGRDTEKLREAYARYRDTDVVGTDVVLCLGNEAPLEEDAVRALISDIDSSKNVWLVNARCPIPWCETNNALLSDIANDFGNVQVIDWYGAVSGHNNYLAEDGMHLASEGVAAYVSCLSAAMGDHSISPLNHTQHAAEQDDADEGQDTTNEEGGATSEEDGYVDDGIWYTEEEDYSTDTNWYTEDTTDDISYEGNVWYDEAEAA